MGCSSHLERVSLTEKEEYFYNLNDELKNEDVVINYIDGKSTEGEFIKINKELLLIKYSNEIKEIKTDDICSLKYNDSSSIPGIIIGSIFGFLAGTSIVTATSAKINFGGGSENPAMFLMIPVGTIAGGIIGGTNAVNSFKTIEFKKCDKMLKVNTH